MAVIRQEIECLSHEIAVLDIDIKAALKEFLECKDPAHAKELKHRFDTLQRQQNLLVNSQTQLYNRLAGMQGAPAIPTLHL